MFNSDSSLKEPGYVDNCKCFVSTCVVENR
jgi:hypothetical protein